jgi:TolB protein
MFQLPSHRKLTIIKRSPLILAATLLGLAALPGDAPADERSAVVIDLNNPKRSLYPIAVPRGAGGDSALSAQIEEVASFNLGVAGWFKVLDPRSFLANLESEGLGIEVPKWKSVGAFGVIKYRVGRVGSDVQIEFRLYEVEKGDKPVLSRSYRGPDARQLVHMWSNEVVEYYTGEPGFFGSKIAFVTKRSGGGKAVMAMDFDGNGVYSVTRNASLNLLPAWSPGGGQVAFTSYMRNNPDLYVVGAGGGRPKLIASHRGMNTGASWSPDGSKIALTLSKDGNPEIYVISASTGKILRRLTNNRAIDTSPAWSPDGREIAFVSDREGGPQIFVMNAEGGNQRRVSMNGSYNTTPTWSPRKGARVLAYTTRDGGSFDIVTLDLETRKMVRITQGQGNNEEPSFSPNGRALAFASTRKEGSGIYIANADGTGKQTRVYKGSATSVDWGPTPK